MSETKFFFGKVLNNIDRLKHELPIVLANQARLHFVDAFRQEGYEGTPWPIPQRKVEGTSAYKYPMSKGLGRRTQSTLVRTGRLKRAVNSSIRSQTFNRIQLIVDVPYAGYLNDGTSKMKAYPFMKDTPVLRAMQLEKIHSFIDKIWQE